MQSFDWSSLNLTKKIAPQLPLVALSSGDAWLEVGQPGASPNLGGIDIDTYGGSLAKAAAAQGYDVDLPHVQLRHPGHDRRSPRSSACRSSPGPSTPRRTWTRLMDLGVDGIITDYPTRLRTVMDERGLKLPKAYASKS